MFSIVNHPVDRRMYSKTSLHGNLHFENTYLLLIMKLLEKIYVILIKELNNLICLETKDQNIHCSPVHEERISLEMANS